MSERKKSGIYVILNTVNGKRYIGQAASIGDRWLTHRSQLERGKHHSRYLQSSWVKYGAGRFDFRVLEYVPAEKVLLAEREQFWMDLLKPEYNLAPSAGSSLGLKHPPRSDEFRKRQGDMRRGKSPSPDALARMRAHAKQRAIDNPWTPSPEHVEKLRAAATGRVHSAAEIEKRRAKMLGRKQSPDSVAKRSAAMQGHAVSEETRAKIGAANRGRLSGTTQSPELIEKRIAPLRGRPRPPGLMAQIHEALRLVRQPTIDAIKRALAEDPNLNQTHLAATLGCGRATIRKYRKLLCQQPKQNDSAAAAKNWPPVPDSSST